MTGRFGSCAWRRTATAPRRRSRAPGRSCPGPTGTARTPIEQRLVWSQWRVELRDPTTHCLTALQGPLSMSGERIRLDPCVDPRPSSVRGRGGAVPSALLEKYPSALLNGERGAAPAAARERRSDRRDVLLAVGGRIRVPTPCSRRVRIRSLRLDPKEEPGRSAETARLLAWSPLKKPNDPRATRSVEKEGDHPCSL
jgi:hypothetical protein